MISLVIALATQVGPEAGEVLRPTLTTSTAIESRSSAPSVTLAQLLTAASERNLDRRITVEQHRKSDLEVKQAWSALVPSLSVQAGWTHNQYESEIPPGKLSPDAVTLVALDQLDLAARVDVPLIDTQRWMRAGAAEASREALAAREQLTMDQVRRAVTTGWYGYAAALALEASAQRSVVAAEAQLEFQEIRERAGAVTELELLRARAEVERNRQSVADAQRLVAVSRRSLTSLTGHDPGPAARLPKLDLSPAGRLEDLEMHVDALPAVRAAEADREGGEKLATAAKLALLPIVGAQFTERVSNSAGFSSHSASFTLGANLQWRLDGPALMGIDVQGSNLAILALVVERTRMAARDQINADWQALHAALTKVQAVKAQVEAVARAREVASKRYQLGAATQLDLIQAERDLFGAEVQQIQAQSDLASARAALQISAGLPPEVP
ncbi:MAG: TolC family protein [Deltaproteobacteria bacterium]|nr:TolC family protein [Deltaproteobacteria bacterium]